MRLIAEGAQNEDVQTLKKAQGVFLNPTAVGDISQGAYPIAQNLRLPMIDLYGAYLMTEETELLFNNVSDYLRDSLTIGGGGEDIFENFPQAVDGGSITVAGDSAFLKIVVYSHLIQPEDMVGMGMSKEDGIDAIDAIAESLLAEVCGAIDEDIVAIKLQKNRRTKTVVPLVGRAAYLTLTANYRYSY